MDNQHRKISGYRELTGNEIDDMNMIKKFGPELENLLNYLSQPRNAYDPRWISVGRTHLQQGLMALTRAVARPDFF